MEFSRLVDVLRNIPRDDLAVVVISTFSLDPAKMGSLLTSARLDPTITRIFHHRHSRGRNHDAMYELLNTFRWLREAERYFHYRFVLALYENNRPCHFAIYAQNVNKFYTRPRELIYRGTPHGLDTLTKEMARLLRSGAFSRRDAALARRLDHVRFTPNDDRLIVQRPRHTTLVQLEALARANTRTAIHAYAPYQSDELDVCEHIADALVTPGTGVTVHVAEPSVEHGFDLGAFVTFRNRLLYTTHNLTEASWIGARTLEISVLTSHVPRSVREAVRSRMRRSRRIHVQVSEC